MVKIERTYPEPKGLAEERNKENPGVRPNRIEGVLKALQVDFKNKCYICEQSAPTKVEVDHFSPHKNNRDLMFTWENLFLACGHCNNTKSNNYNTNDDNEILNCTNPQHDVVNWIRYECNSQDYKITVTLTTFTEDNAYKKSVDNTVKLLTEVYTGGKSPTPTHEVESFNLRTLLKDQIFAFEMILKQYERSV
ncbi:HNH endonuclease, partial [Candidatus Magnetobacterium bavaricum]